MWYRININSNLEVFFIDEIIVKVGDSPWYRIITNSRGFEIFLLVKLLLILRDLAIFMTREPLKSLKFTRAGNYYVFLDTNQ